MAAWTKATLAERVLEHLGVVGEGQSATAEQQVRTEEVIDSLHPQLRKLGLSPFLTSSVPEWAQQPLLRFVAAAMAPKFGFSGQRLLDFTLDPRTRDVPGKRELQEQVAAQAHTDMPIRVKYY
jgi:hypothetical protein